MRESSPRQPLYLDFDPEAPFFGVTSARQVVKEIAFGFVAAVMAIVVFSVILGIAASQ
jgi:hypothetical protein